MNYTNYIPFYSGQSPGSATYDTKLPIFRLTPCQGSRLFSNVKETFSKKYASRFELFTFDNFSLQHNGTCMLASMNFLPLFYGVNTFGTCRMLFSDIDFGFSREKFPRISGHDYFRKKTHGLS